MLIGTGTLKWVGRSGVADPMLPGAVLLVIAAVEIIVGLLILLGLVGRDTTTSLILVAVTGTLVAARTYMLFTKNPTARCSCLGSALPTTSLSMLALSALLLVSAIRLLMSANTVRARVAHSGSDR